MVYPDQEGVGTLVVPNSVALVRGAPRAEAGRQFIEFLLRPETEELLSKSRSRQMPVRASVPLPTGATPLSSIVAMKVDWAAVAGAEPFLKEAWEALAP